MGTGRLPRDLEEQRLRLLRLSRRRSFESYMRYGRVPEGYRAAAAFAEKAAGPGADVSVTALATRRPTSYYVWRAAGDERVGPSHAALADRVFSWSNPPADGHPGTEPNCRCWAEPYYGGPVVPDSSLLLQRAIEDDATARLWNRIETFRRPDGSLARSVILGRDGTRFLSLFSGAHVAHLIALATGHTVRLETSNGVQTLYLNGLPLLQTAWTNSGPEVTRARRQVAFLLDDASPNSIFEEPAPDLKPDAIVDPMRILSLGGTDASGGLGILGLAALAYYAMQQAAPASLGLGDDDRPILIVKAWGSGGEAGVVPVMVDALTAERVRQSCTRLQEVEAWTDEAAKTLASERALMSPASWGPHVHKLIKDMISVLKKNSPAAYRDIEAELSLDEVGQVYYSKQGSTRLDVLEDRRNDMGAVCAYDIKTGQEGLTPSRIAQIAKVVVKVYGGVMFYIIEVRPKR